MAKATPIAKPRSITEKLAIVVGIGMTVLVAAVVLFIAVAIWQGDRQEAQNKALLTQEVKTMPIPAGCSESRREYGAGGLDARSTWVITYSCDTTGGAAYDTIVAGLKDQSYKAQRDLSLPSSGEASQLYAFTYDNGTFNADYTFRPDDTFTDQTAMHASHVNTIYLSLSRTLQ